jgi:hypothetical protein
MLMMRVNGLNSESIMVLKRRYATLEVKDAIINNKKSSMLWVRLYDRYVPFFSKWMTCMKVISIKESNPLICKEDQ